MTKLNRRKRDGSDKVRIRRLGGSRYVTIAPAYFEAAGFSEDDELECDQFLAGTDLLIKVRRVDNATRQN